MSGNEITGRQLKDWRLDQDPKITQEQIAAFVNTTGPTVGRWEKGQSIPGPEQLLLRYLMFGTLPFQPRPKEGAVSLPDILEFSQDEWNALTILARREGYSTTPEFIADKLRGYLSMRERQPVRDSRKFLSVAEDSAPYGLKK